METIYSNSQLKCKEYIKKHKALVMLAFIKILIICTHLKWDEILILYLNEK